MLRKDLEALGVYSSGWNAEKERYVNIAVVEIPIQDSRATVSNVVPLINMANHMLGLRAMQKFSQWLGSEASLDVNLSVGTSSPVGELFDQPQQRFRSEMDALNDLLKIGSQELQQQRTAIMASASIDEASKREVDEKIAEMTQAIDILNREASGNPATLTRMNRALDAVLKNLILATIRQQRQLPLILKLSRCRRSWTPLRQIEIAQYQLQVSWRERKSL